MFNLTPFNRDLPSVRQNNFVDFYNMIDDFFNDSLMSPRNLSADSFKMDVTENEKDYLIEAELPGIKKEEISLNLDNNYLTIAISRQEQKDNGTQNYVHRERRISSMQRSLYLQNILGDDITAKFDNGILAITVPKKDTAKVQTRINID